MFAQVIVPLPLPPLTYRVPASLSLQVGSAVRVSVRKKIIDGVVARLDPDPPTHTTFTVKDLEGPSLDFPELRAETVELLTWAATYYHCPVGEVLRGFLPPDPAPPTRESWRVSQEGQARLSRGEKPRGRVQAAVLARISQEPGAPLASHERPAARKLRADGWLHTEQAPDEQLPPPPAATSAPLSLTDKQAVALEALRESLAARRFETFLLEGVTGSGKTEVYLRAAAQALADGRNVLAVVPEISLTPQLVGRFRARLGEPVAVLHSGISDGERSRQWHLINQGKYRVCIGARSASFAPMPNLGLLIVDEEHDSALKQEDHLRYHGRDLMIVRGQRAGATVVLGSATPSLETFQHARAGKFRHLQLPERASGRAMPEVVIIDQARSASEGSITRELKREMELALGKGGQVMLLLNRRGFSSFLLCESCGHVPQCPNCSVSLTNYRSSSQLKCHYCGHVDRMPTTCSACGNEGLRAGTPGTESLEEEVKQLFPGRSVIRIDRESTERKGALEQALSAIASGAAQIVIGTQIIAKGHDFPNIALVGVVNADSSFHLPDFRAAEKSLQLFTQMAGRAGRGESPGRVVIQTFNPNHPSIAFSVKHDHRGFAEEELRIRHEFHYPPFFRLARVLVSAPDGASAEQEAERIAARIRRHPQAGQLEVVGPAPAVLAKVQNRHRWQLLLKSQRAAPLHAVLHHCVAQEKSADRRLIVQIDVDPVSLM